MPLENISRGSWSWEFYLVSEKNFDEIYFLGNVPKKSFGLIAIANSNPTLSQVIYQRDDLIV